MKHLVALLVLSSLTLGVVLYSRIEPDRSVVEAGPAPAPARALVDVTTTTAPPTTTTTVLTKERRETLFEANVGPCGGDLPPCWVMMRESGGDPNAYNPTGCSGRGCYGKWQFDPRTGDGTGTEEEQDAEARRVWDGGRGCSHWDAC